IWQCAVCFQVGDKIRQEKVVQNDNTRDLLQKPNHMRMKRRISEVVQDAVVSVRVVMEPIDRTDRKGPGDGAADFLLRYYAFNIVVVAQLRQEFGAIIADAARFGGYWRNKGQLPPRARDDGPAPLFAAVHAFFQS